MKAHNLNDVLTQLQAVPKVSVKTENPSELPEYRFLTERSDALRWVRGLANLNADKFPIKEVLEDALNISVHYEAMDGKEELSGYIEKRANGWHIGVNKYEVEGRQRFTMAHELGHLLFHRDIIQDQMVDGKFVEAIKLFRSQESFKRVEMQANQFSADLLMPSDRVRLLWDKFADYTDIADIFGVSTYAVEYRGRTLKLPAKQ